MEASLTEPCRGRNGILQRWVVMLTLQDVDAELSRLDATSSNTAPIVTPQKVIDKLQEAKARLYDMFSCSKC